MNSEERKELRITELQCLTEALKDEMEAIDLELEKISVQKDREWGVVAKEHSKAREKLNKLIPEETYAFSYEGAINDLFGGSL